MPKRGKASCMADCVVRIFIAICASVEPAFHNRLSCDVFALNLQAAVIPRNLK
jgi:hypothetical protein